ncbi:hypothetical protein BHM03_00023731, partial [Ensete ventricosum]
KGSKGNELRKDFNLSKETQDDLEISEDYDGNENMESYEEATDVGDGVNEVSNQMGKSLSLGTVTSKRVPDVKVQGLSGNSASQACTSSEAVRPCGRINSCMVVGKDTLYLYGGMMEVKDREITLDDLYSLNLSKLDEWKCIIPASESEWLEVSEDDDDDDIDDGTEESSSDDNDETDDDDNDEDDGNLGSSGDGNMILDMGSAVSVLKGEGKKLRRKEKRARIEQIRISLGLSDSQRTPMPGESLRDFYRRTCMYWQMAAHEHTQHTGKELRKDGFDLADSRFKELKPILDELAILEAEQKAEEEEAESSSRKRGGKNNKLKASQK